MTFDIEQLRDLPSPFYRVTLRALIFNDSEELLVFRNKAGFWELPGGGWEHPETFEESIHREVSEEIGATVESVAGLVSAWTSRNVKRGYMQLRIGVLVKLQSNEFEPSGEAAEVRFVSKQQFLALPLELWEEGAKEQADTIWTENIRGDDGE